MNEQLTIERMIEYGRSVDFAPLFAAVEKELGIKIEFNPVTFEERRGRVVMELTSKSVLKGYGLFRALLNEAQIDNFGGGVVLDENTGEFHLWVPVHISYQHKDGGSNGMENMTAHFKDGVWNIRRIGR